jgi:hypothetical protein
LREHGITRDKMLEFDFLDIHMLLHTSEKGDAKDDISLHGQFAISYRDDKFPDVGTWLSTQKRWSYIILPLVLMYDEGAYHVNVIVVDFVTKTWYRYDPHGMSAVHEDDYGVEGRIKRVCKHYDYKFIGLKQTMPVSGPQSFEELNDLRNTLGYCNAWCVWMLFVIMSKQIYPLFQSKFEPFVRRDILNCMKKIDPKRSASYLQYIQGFIVQLSKAQRPTWTGSERLNWRTVFTTDKKSMLPKPLQHSIDITPCIPHSVIHDYDCLLDDSVIQMIYNNTYYTIKKSAVYASPHSLEGFLIMSRTLCVERGNSEYRDLYPYKSLTARHRTTAILVKYEMKDDCYKGLLEHFMSMRKQLGGSAWQQMRAYLEACQREGMSFNAIMERTRNRTSSQERNAMKHEWDALEHYVEDNQKGK